MNFTETMEELRGRPYPEILEIVRNKMRPVLGKIQGTQLKLLQSFIGATGLRTRLANAPAEQLAAASAIIEAIQPEYLAKEDSYSINLADPQVAGLLAGAVTVGLMSAQESQYLHSLATYSTPMWPGITLRDVVAYFEPALVEVGDWTELLPGNKRQLLLNLAVATPESTAIRVEMRESHDGQHWTAWRRVTPFVGVMDAGIYYQAIQNNGLQRQIRWRGDQYLIQGTVEAV